MKTEDSGTIVIDTPIGHFKIEAFKRRIAKAAFTDEPLSDHSMPLLQTASRQYRQYFRGERHYLQLPLGPMGTPFQQKVWLALERLEFGKTCSYADIAAQLGTPKAVSAVAQAIGRNPIAIAIPCHRVIGQDGQLADYSWGTERKAWMLDLEKRALAA